MKRQFLVFNCLLPLALLSCSGLEKSEKAKIKRLSVQKERISRHEGETCYVLENPKKRAKRAYFWDNKVANHIPKITKEYFRCKGSYKNLPIHLNANTPKAKYFMDCNGFDEHSLPVKDDKEFIYPALIDILNFVQEKSQKQVIITCGHRCPKHNLYAERNAAHSKHLMGAEVDFYVLGMQSEPSQIIDLIRLYYEDKEKRFGSLLPSNISKSFENKEIRLSLKSSHESQDFDNRHPYPYLTIELKYDREAKKAVHYNWHISHQRVMKW